jgi:IS30 family transposase
MKPKTPADTTDVKTMKRKQEHDANHLTLDHRKIIQTGIENNATKADIARTLGKDATTIAKEIRKHRQFQARNTYNRPVMCAKLKSCPHKPCVKKCDAFEEPVCTRRDKSPGACNKCATSSHCYLDKYYYDAAQADKSYHTKLSESREGINLTTEDRDRIGTLIAPLLLHGQSVHQILSAHPEISQSERTMYTYIEDGVFKAFGVNNFSLKEQVNRRQFRDKYKKRKEPVNYHGRNYSDYLRFLSENPGLPTVEMDTVYNAPEGPYLQTFIFENTWFMVGLLHKEKSSECMSAGVNLLQHRLGSELFSKIFPLVLTDRGAEFEKCILFEKSPTGDTRLRIFYCDPMQSSQKPHVENNHNYVRDIIPNGYPMSCLTQDDVELMFSHINSTPRRVLGDKTPLETFRFFYGADAIQRLGIREIQRDDVVLKPSLIYTSKRTRKASGLES